jgi:hypothetical protein
MGGNKLAAPRQSAASEGGDEVCDCDAGPFDERTNGAVRTVTGPQPLPCPQQLGETREEGGDDG